MYSNINIYILYIYMYIRTIETSYIYLVNYLSQLANMIFKRFYDSNNI